MLVRHQVRHRAVGSAAGGPSDQDASGASRGLPNLGHGHVQGTQYI